MTEDMENNVTWEEGGTTPHPRVFLKSIAFFFEISSWLQRESPHTPINLSQNGKTLLLIQ